eukprot:755338-Hanusia_phi.AAC.2
MSGGAISRIFQQRLLLHALPVLEVAPNARILVHAPATRGKGGMIKKEFAAVGANIMLQGRGAEWTVLTPTRQGKAPGVQRATEGVHLTLLSKDLKINEIFATELMADARECGVRAGGDEAHLERGGVRALREPRGSAWKCPFSTFGEWKESKEKQGRNPLKEKLRSWLKSKEWIKAKSSRTPSRSEGAFAPEQMQKADGGVTGRRLSLLFYAIMKYVELEELICIMKVDGRGLQSV